MSNKNVNILYYFEPWIELSRPHLRYHNLRYQVGPQIRALKKNNNGVDIKIAIGEGTLNKCQAEGYDFEGCEYVVLARHELTAISPNYLESSKSLFNGDPRFSLEYSEYLSDKLDGWQPDFIISFLAPLPNLSSVWPNSSTVYAEFGMFSRAPYPRTFYFDPDGMFSKSSLRRYSTELLTGTLDKGEHELLADFRENYLFSFYKQHPILDEELALAANKFECKLLLPLQFSAYFGFDCCAPYADQFEYLIDVLDAISPDIGVFVTEHAGWPDVLTEHNIGYLKDRYPNLLWSPRLSKIRSASQYLMGEVDGVITVSSSVGTQCMAWDKPLFSPWNSHLTGYSQVSALNEITIEKVRSYQAGTYDYPVFQLLTRYYMTEDYAYDGKHFLGYLEVAKARKGLSSFVARFPSHRSATEVFKSLRESYRECDGHRLYLQDLGNEIENVVASISGKVPDDFKKALENIDTVSFDLFDTLVDRPFSAPHELFLSMQPTVRELVSDFSLEFHKLRRYAEHRARQLSDHNEVSVRDIYNIFCSISGVCDSFIDNLIQLELSWELKFCRRRPSGSALYEYAASKGKRIICISDFYFGESDLSAVTESLGYRFHQMFVSADYQESKKEGTLFKEVIRSSIANPARTLHVGDNHQSDIVNAGNYGFRTYFTPKAIERLTKQPISERVWKKLLNRTVFPSEKAQLGQAVFLGLAARRLFDSRPATPRASFGEGDPTQLGYVVLGPLLFAFTQWLITQIKRKNRDRVFFLSRDGRLFKRTYDLFCRADSSLPESVYLLSSRRAYSLASVSSVSDAQELIAIPFEPTDVSTIFNSRFSIVLDEHNCGDEVLETAGLHSLSGKVHPVHDLMRLKRLVALLYPMIEAKAEEERGALLVYLDKIGYSSSLKPAIVDIGYAGSLQRYLAKLTGNVELTGHYFMTHSKAEEYKWLGLDISAYYRENVDHQLKKDLLSSQISLFELLFSSDEASLVKFEWDGSTVSPKLKEQQNEPNRIRLVQLIQRGALEFVDDALHFFGREHTSIHFSPDFAVHNLESLIVAPDRADALLFNGIHSEDGFSGKDRRYIVRDVNSALRLKEGKLTKTEARDLVGLSEWKAAASAILLTPTSGPANVARPQERSEAPQQTKHFMGRPVRLYRKLRRDPHQYFADSSVPFLRPLKYVFK